MKTIHHLLLSIVLLFVSPILIPSKMSAQTEVAAPNVFALGNYPATMVAVAANTTVTPDASPAGVASINVSTDSNFKGTFVANTTTGVVGITNAHPAGSYVVTVKGFASLGGMSSRTFALTVVSGTVCNPVQFINAADLTSVSRPNAVAIGDFNNDGIQDIAAAVGAPNTVAIRLGDGSGGFTGTTDVIVSNLSRNVAIGDFNNDGNQDFAASDNGFGGSVVVSIRLGNGAGGFSNGPDVILPQGAKFVAIGDFNNDGREDLAIATFDTVEIRLGDGSGGFTGTTSISLGGNRPNYIAIGDFNNDGNQDFAATNQQSVVSIGFGDGLGGFSGITSVPVGQGPTSVAIGDFNNDGNQDFASADQTEGEVNVHLGDGLGGFDGGLSVTAGDRPTGVAIGDFNNDGNQDFAVTNENGNGAGTNSVSIRLGNGSGGFSNIPDVLVGPGAVSIAIGDFNSDGMQDFATADTGAGGSVSIRLGGCVVTSTLELTDAVSRKTHGVSGDFDLPLVLSPAGSGTVEPRAKGPTKVVFTFSDNVVAADGTIDADEFTIVNANFSSAAIFGNKLTLNLTGVIDQSVVSVTLHGITDNNGNSLSGDNDVEIRALVGDVNQDRQVKRTDHTVLEAHQGQSVDQSNFLDDISLNGKVSQRDENLQKKNVGHTVP